MGSLIEAFGKPSRRGASGLARSGGARRLCEGFDTKELPRADSECYSRWRSPAQTPPEAARASLSSNFSLVRTEVLRMAGSAFTNVHGRTSSTLRFRRLRAAWERRTPERTRKQTFVRSILSV